MPALAMKIFCALRMGAGTGAGGAGCCARRMGAARRTRAGRSASAERKGFMMFEPQIF